MSDQFCNQKLRESGKPYPRTCKECQIGRCKFSRPSPQTDHSDELDPCRPVLHDILLERERQDQKWGGYGHDDTHTFAEWEQFLNKFWDRALIAVGPNRHKKLSQLSGNLPSLRSHLVNVAALCVAMIQVIDRKIERSGKN